MLKTTFTALATSTLIMLSSPMTAQAADLVSVSDVSYDNICERVTNNPALANRLLANSAALSPEDKEYLGGGLGCAARGLAASRPAATDAITQAVLGTQDDVIINAFNAALSDTPTAAIGNGGGGGPVTRAFNFGPGSAGAGAPGLASPN